MNKNKLEVTTKFIDVYTYVYLWKRNWTTQKTNERLKLKILNISLIKRNK